VASPSEAVRSGRRDMSEQPRSNAYKSLELQKLKADDYRSNKVVNQTNNEFFSPFKNNYNNMVRDFPVSVKTDNPYSQQQYNTIDYQPRSRGDGQISLHSNEGKTSVKVNNPPGGKTSIQLW